MRVTPPEPKNYRQRSVVCKSLIMLVLYSYQLWERKRLKVSTVPFPLLRSPQLTRWQCIGLSLLVTSIICNYCTDCFVEYLVDTGHLLAAAFHIAGPHLPRNCHALLLGDRSKALGLKKIDAGSFCSKVGLQADENERGIRAKV